MKALILLALLVFTSADISKEFQDFSKDLLAKFKINEGFDLLIKALNEADEKFWKASIESIHLIDWGKDDIEDVMRAVRVETGGVALILAKVFMHSKEKKRIYEIIENIGKIINDEKEFIKEVEGKKEKVVKSIEKLVEHWKGNKPKDAGEEAGEFIKWFYLNEKSQLYT